MIKVAFVATVAAALFGASMAQAASVPVVESNGKRPGATVDIANSDTVDLGTIGPGASQGFGGRIVSAIDRWEFSAETGVTIGLADLMLGDGNKGFDATTTGLSTNGIMRATFSLFDISGAVDTLVDSIVLSSQFGGGDLSALVFNAGPGQYRFDIDGASGSAGSTYEFLISAAAVPLPAAAPLFLGGLGLFYAVSRRRS